MQVDFTSENRIDIKLNDKQSLTIMSHGNELSFSFNGGKKVLKELQNRSDGYSGATFTDIS